MSTAVLPGAGLPDVNHGPEILGACITMTAVALLLVGTRMYVRVAMIRSVGWDDYFIVAAMVCLLPTAFPPKLSATNPRRIVGRNGR